MLKNPFFDKVIEYPVIVTGATGGIGTHISRRLASMGIPLLLACRSTEKYHRLEDELKRDFPEVPTGFMQIDLGDSASVRDAVERLDGRRIFGLINNAGTMNRHFHIGADGREDTLNVNYYNTRLLSEMLMPQIVKGGAIVFTTSVTRKSGYSYDLPERVTEEMFSQLGTYALSKKLITRYAAFLCETMSESGMSESGIRINCADPGIVDSGMITLHRWYDPLADIFFRPFIRRPENGALPAVRALLSEKTARIFTLRNDHPLC